MLREIYVFCNLPFGEKLNRLVMLKESVAPWGAELGRIHTISLHCNPVFISTPPKTAPLLLRGEM